MIQKIKRIGSYKKNDVVFLLKRETIKEIEILEKEKLIQSGEKHYSDLITKEYIPSKKYLKVFKNILKENSYKLSTHIIQLSHYINNNYKQPIIVSLMRGGTPIGVLLKKTIYNFFNKEVKHYSISIIRDRGLDLNALMFILKEESLRRKKTINEIAENIIFVDGWTGKGVINKELKESVLKFNLTNNLNVSNQLFVVSDISFNSNICSTHEDYLIPTAVLNSTISGLVSRSVYNQNKNEFHLCKEYNHLKKEDLSKWFIINIMKVINKIYKRNKIIFEELNFVYKINEDNKSHLFEIQEIMKKYNISNINFIKPGIGETTRVLLRRLPEFILLKNLDNKNVKHIIELCREKNIKIIKDQNIPYSAIGVIKTV